MAYVHLFFSTVLAGGAFFSAADAFAAEQNLPLTLSVNTHTNTLSTPLTASASLFADLKNSYQTAGVCFIGFGDCVEDAGFGKGGDDYSLDTASQCKNEGYVLNNCNSVQSPKAYCPYNKSYVSGCKCASNLITCPAGQVGVGDACDGKYASCKCDPNLKSCASNQTGQGASCGGKYQSCVCKPEYQYNSSNCTSPRSLTGASCGGKYTGCSCPTGITSLPYGCEEYYASPCNSVCKKAYVDNCRNRTAVSTPYGCQTYWADCPSKCQKAYPDNCRNRTAATCAFGCQTYWSDCQSKCQTCKTDNCANRAAVSTPYGCQTYWPDCSSKCQVAFADNCRNRTASLNCMFGCQTYWSDCKSKCQSCYPDNCHERVAVDAPYGCQTYWPDCKSKCQIATPLTCSYAARKAHPEAVVVATQEEFSTAAESGKKIYLSDELSQFTGTLKNGTALHSASELSDKCKEIRWKGRLSVYKGSKINIPYNGSIEVYGSFSYSKDLSASLSFQSYGADANIAVTSENNASIDHDPSSLLTITNAGSESISIDNLKCSTVRIQSKESQKLILRKSAEIDYELSISDNVQLSLEDGTFDIGSLELWNHDGTNRIVNITNSTVNLNTLYLNAGTEITLDNSTLDMSEEQFGKIEYYNQNSTYYNREPNANPDSYIRFKNGSKLLNLSNVNFSNNHGYGLQYIFEADSHSYITTTKGGFCSYTGSTVTPQDTTTEARIQNYSAEETSKYSICLDAEYCKTYAKCTNISFR